MDPSGAALLDVRGMWCTSCANALERVLQRQPGVLDAQVSFPSESATLEWDPGVTTLPRLLDAAGKLGYCCTPEGEAVDRRAYFARLIHDLTQRLVVASFCSMWVMTAQATLYFTSEDVVPPPVRFGLAVFAAVASLPVLGWCAIPFYRAAWRTVRAGVPGMDCLITMGAGASFLLSVWHLLQGDSTVYFDSGSMIINFLLAGRWLEIRARSHASDAVRSLLTLPAETARVLEADSTVSTVLAKRVAAGSVIRVLPGERLALDGIITHGVSSLARPLLTGESEPVLVTPGTCVEAGALNGEGELLVRVTHAWGERRVDDIARSVRRMLAGRTASQALAEQLTRHMVPVIAIAALLTLLALHPRGLGWGAAVERAVTVLVITCPCAIGMAVPLALSAGVGRAARQGILFRDVEAIEKAGSLSMFLVDKTGTLTEGEPRLVDVRRAPEVTWDELLEEVALAERGSEHAIAKAILALLSPEQRAAIQVPVGSSRAVPGAGIEWQGEDGGWILAGTADLLRSHCVEVPDSPGTSTLVHVARDGRWRGRLGFADRPRQGARECLARLRAGGAAVVMLTGDRMSVAQSVAQAVGVPQEAILAGRSPEQKAAHIRAAQAAGFRVAFVGDGLNDAPALAAADLGVAVGSASASSMAAASIVLDAGIEKLDSALSVAHRTAAAMRQNLTAALAYNVLAVPLAVAGLVSPTLAAALMVASSLSVTLNTCRLALGQDKPGASGSALRAGFDRRPAAGAVQDADAAALNQHPG
jgi:heavy metal translocating P-type ATPase